MRRRRQHFRHRGSQRRFHPAAVLFNPFLHLVCLFNQPVIRLFCCLAKGEMAVIEQEQPFDTGRFFINRRRPFRQLEPGHDKRDQRHFITENRFHHRLGLRQIGQGEHGGGVGVIDINMRQIGMQQGFNRGVRRGGIEQIAALDIDHILIRQRLQSA